MRGNLLIISTGANGAKFLAYIRELSCVIWADLETFCELQCYNDWFLLTYNVDKFFEPRFISLHLLPLSCLKDN